MRRVSGGRISGVTTAGLYALFAAMAILVNLGAQWATDAVVPGAYGVFVALLAGTAAGLIVKYLLDKRYIFRYTTVSRRHEARTFVVYCVMSVSTTAIFWICELGFRWGFRSAAAGYVGGAIGLVIGYAVKYALDNRFTFTAHPRAGAEGAR